MISFSSQLGIRYDWDELVPQDLKAFCRACSSKPASNTFQSLSGSFGLDAGLLLQALQKAFKSCGTNSSQS